jgi:hypothetical protein
MSVDVPTTPAADDPNTTEPRVAVVVFVVRVFVPPRVEYPVKLVPI